MLFKRHMSMIVAVLFLLPQAVPWGVPDYKQPAAVSYCDWAQFVMDVTVPDGTTLAIGTPFTKTWRLKNIGSCTWTTGYALVYKDGDMMSAPAVVNLPQAVQPGEMVDLSVQMTAPAAWGHFRGNWLLRNEAGVKFGIGSTASDPFWVDINVSSPTVTVYDFTADICSASWYYNGGPIPCPVREKKTLYGFPEKLDNPILENGSAAGQVGLLMVPQNKYNGIIIGVYPVFDVVRGDRFQALVGCEYGAVDCYVTFELNYLSPISGLVRIWRFREKYDGLFYRVDLDLGKYADMQRFQLVLIVSATGSPSGDRAIWVAPRIVRPVSGSLPTSTAVAAPPTATAIPSATPTITPTLPPASACDKVQFVQDVTIPDGTSMPPGQAFTKTWRISNAGTCTWTQSYSLAFVSGDQMGGVSSIPLPATVAPGEIVDLSVNLTAPMSAGNYAGYWMLRNASGGFFGIGSAGEVPLSVKISVPSSSSPNGYDFVGNSCSATWSSGAGSLPCPGTESDPGGFVLQLNNPILENGSTDPRPGLLTAPQVVDYGWIQGTYPAMVVQNGDRFQATVGCQYNAQNCDVFYRLDYQIDNGPISTLWVFRERYDGLSYDVDLDLSSLVGQNVKFILTVLANGPAAGDRAMWVAARINRPGLNPLISDSPTYTPTPTFTPSATFAPEATITPSETLQSVPSGTPTPSSTPSPTPSATATSPSTTETPTPTPTP